MKKLFALLFFILGAVSLVATMVILGADLVSWGFDGRLTFRDFGRLWFDLHSASLNLTQAIIQRYLDPALFDSVVLPVLLSPAALVFAVLSAAFLLGRRLLLR